MPSILVIDDAGHERIRRLVTFASQPENYYRPGPLVPTPGDNSRYVVTLGTYRCVFTHTKMPDGRLYRHLSISVKRNDRFPLPEGVEMVGKLFGFEDSFATWLKHIDKDAQAIVIGQEIDVLPN